ncbi:MAG: enoyl-CoA hydratase/isomerase family protein [Gammaproteobacteria bacterium]|nr:enoyl-CoA hydratase/isomerase family protein [Gammaproteobacteria bacterium]
MNVVLTELVDGVLTITLNRPEVLNAYNLALHRALLDALDIADADDAVRAVILTGAGRGFCAGMDLSAGGDTFDNRQHETIDQHRDGGGELTLRLFDMKKPVIAAINGPATGVGLTLTLACDVRLGVPGAKMGFVFARRGIAPDACSSWFAPRIVGLAQALEWFVSGRIFTAEEALAKGLVSELLARDDLLPRAQALAREFTAATSAVSVAIARRLLWRMQGAAHPREAFALESKALWYVGGAPDAREGVLSFLEKRPPQFTMKVSSDFPDFL